MPGAIHGNQPLDGLGVEESFAHRSVDDPGGDRVDGDAAARHLERQRLGGAVERALGRGVVDLAACCRSSAATDDTLTMRPQRVRIIGITSGCVTLKNPLTETSMTRATARRASPGNTASSWTPALLTSIWIGPSSSTGSSAAWVAAVSVMSKHSECARPPLATYLLNNLIRNVLAAVGMHKHFVAVACEAAADRRADAPAASCYECALTGCVHSLSPWARRKFA